MKQGRGRLARTARMTASGVRRYSREMVDSLAGRSRARVMSPGLGRSLHGFGMGGLSAVWLGHASVLMHVASERGGVTILADPVFSNRVGLRVGPVTFGVGRLSPAPVQAEDLPPIDVVLLSHAHFDHLDRPTLRRLASERTTVITARGTKRLVPRGFARVIELDWTCRTSVESAGGGGVTVSAVRPRHWGARFACDRSRGFNSYVIEGGDRRRVLFGGDTAMTDAFDAVGPVDLAVMGIGSYEPWEHAHATPEQVWSMFRGMSASDPGRGVLLPMHHSTFPLGDEGRHEPLTRLLAAAGSESHRVVGRALGEVWTDGCCGEAEHAGSRRASTRGAMPAAAGGWIGSSARMAR